MQMIEARKNEDALGEERAIAVKLSTDALPFLLLLASTTNDSPARISLSICDVFLFVDS